MFVVFNHSGSLPLFSLSAGSLDESGKQVGVHQEYVFLFGVFDEKESKYKPNSYAPDKHVKYTINGFTEGSLPGQSCCHSLSLGPYAPGSQLSGQSECPWLKSVREEKQKKKKKSPFSLSL